MSDAKAPDRRMLFNAIVGVLILGIAAALFWPRGGGEPDADSLVLTPESDSLVDGTSTDPALQASVDSAPLGESTDEATMTPADPFPATETKRAELTESTPEPVVSKPIQQPTRSTSSLEPGRSGRFYLVVGSYTELANAQREVRRLTGEGISATSVPATTADGGVHRIHVGYFESREDAEAYGRKLKQSMGLDSWVGTR